MIIKSQALLLVSSLNQPFGSYEPQVLVEKHSEAWWELRWWTNLPTWTLGCTLQRKTMSWSGSPTRLKSSVFPAYLRRGRNCTCRWSTLHSRTLPTPWCLGSSTLSPIQSDSVGWWQISIGTLLGIRRIAICEQMKLVDSLVTHHWRPSGMLRMLTGLRCSPWQWKCQIAQLVQMDSLSCGQQASHIYTLVSSYNS